MKKILLSIVVVAAGLFVASCGNKQEQAPEAAGDEQQTEATLRQKAMQAAGNYMNELYIKAKVVDNRYLFF